MLDITDFPYLDSAQLFQRVAGRPWSMFFDSGISGRQRPRAVTERYDVLLIEPIAQVVTQGRLTDVVQGGATSTSDNDPLEVLKETVARCLSKVSDERPSPAYLPGAYGYFSYDLARRFEELPEIAENDEQLPEMAMGVFDSIVLVDHTQRNVQLVCTNSDSSSAQAWQEILTAEEGGKTNAGAGELQAEAIVPNQTRQEYQNSFDQVRRYTIEGDCYQVNLTKRFSCHVTGSAWATYQHLRTLSPAPYGCYIHLPFAQVLSNSPESFIRCRQRAVTTSPIKGTRPRNHDDPKADQHIAQELAKSAKDRAENLMIVDLMRNDLSRSCELGSVNVPSLFSLHAFANVHHLISTVTGRLRKELHALDLLRSCFPGGSITGAPKIRAMEIIETLEPHRRGLYCGSIGYVGMDGSLETNIAIRTIVVKDGTARFSAGGGLVIDSDAGEEYQELLDKASMMRTVLS